jgi:hypothetical protein
MIVTLRDGRVCVVSDVGVMKDATRDGASVVGKVEE